MLKPRSLVFHWFQDLPDLRAWANEANFDSLAGLPTLLGFGKETGALFVRSTL